MSCLVVRRRLWAAQRFDLQNVHGRVGRPPAFPESRCVDFEEPAVRSHVLDVALDQAPGLLIEGSVGTVEAAKIKVPDHLRLYSAKDFVLSFEVGLKEGLQVALECIEAGLEGRSVKVDRNAPDVVDAADDVFDRVAVCFENAFQLLYGTWVNRFGFEAKQNRQTVSVERFEPLRFFDVGSERLHQACAV
jgi:hypothetical protein